MHVTDGRTLIELHFASKKVEISLTNDDEDPDAPDYLQGYAFSSFLGANFLTTFINLNKGKVIGSKGHNGLSHPRRNIPHHLYYRDM